MKKIILTMFLIVSVFSFSEGRCSSKLLGTSTGEIINIKNGDEIHPLASVTKMMTIDLTYEAIKNGEISMDDMVVIEEDIRHIGGSRIWMGRNDRLSVRDLLKATAVYSANNAAYSLAYYVSGGDLDKFIRRMNEKAEELGMINTSYYTPAGLPPHMTGTKMDVSTVNDIYKLSMELLKNEDYMKIASMKEASIRNGSQSFLNRNKLLGKDGIYGMKTGHHSLAGYNISIASKKNGFSVLEIVFGAKDEKTRDTVVIEDLEDFYSNYTYRNILTEGDKIGMVEIKNGVKANVSFYAEKDYNSLLKKGVKVKKEIILNEDIEAPIEVGTIVGEYRILLNNEVYLKKDLVIKESIEKLGLFKRIFN